jgi:predicted DNA-binding transcriptional regulator AlpA
MHTTKQPKKYLTLQQLCTRWGDRSRMFVERRLRNDPDFPRPIRLGSGRIRLFDEAEVEDYEKRSA